MKIAPGVRLNFNKGSTSVTFGGKGAKYTVNSSGRKTASVGLPGTGVSYSTTVKDENMSYAKKKKGKSGIGWVAMFLVMIGMCFAVPSNESEPKEPTNQIVETQAPTSSLTEVSDILLPSQEDPAAEKAEEKPAETPAEYPIDAPAEKPAEKPAETPAEKPAETPKKEETAEITVYITESGSKYHRDGCRHLAKSKIETTLSKAAGKYDPCGTCKPPTN